MSKKTYALVTAIVGGVALIASGVVTFLNPPHATAVNSVIDIMQTATLESCLLFVAEETFKKSLLK